MGFFKKDELLLDFKGGYTEDISSTIPYMHKLNAQANTLVSQLNPNSNYNAKGLVLFNESEHYDMYKLFEKSTNVNNNDNNFSETSPFISSDVYNQLLTKINHKQLGGAKKHKKQSEDDSEDDSTTSSDSSDSHIINKKKKKALQRKNYDDDEVDLEPEEEDELSDISGGSYLSSSAHTDNNSDESNNSTTKSNISTVSAKNHHRRNYSDSINTSDINIISVDE
jgi:hypothetical protein